MGFYGNISSSNRSTFQFDKIYPNRFEMDQACANGTDNVFIGRYVLVDYDTQSRYASGIAAIEDNGISGITNVIPGYKKVLYVQQDGALIEIADQDKPLCVDAAGNYPFNLGNTNSGDTVTEGSYILSLGEIQFLQTFNDEGDEIFKFFKIDYSKGVELYVVSKDENNKIIFNLFSSEELPIEDVNKNNYLANYRLDNRNYSTAGRGWDSTVWQKTYKDGNLKFIMIAELNSVVPTFDIRVDAPTETPVPPHFDTDMSNVYYPIHVQPSWGFRIKTGENEYSEYSIDKTNYPSDITGKFIADSELETSVTNGYINHKIINKETYNDVPLAIYFNKDGLNKYVSADPKVEDDVIKVTPSGYSGNKYFNHEIKENGNIISEESLEAKQYPDTYELSIMLPSLGKAVSDMWDIVYGKGTVNDNLGHPLYDKSSGTYASDSKLVRNTAMEWNTLEGKRMVSDETGYDSTGADSLASMINSVHDLMGMIIVEPSGAAASLSNDNVKGWDPNKIYYINGKFYRKGKQYDYTALGENEEAAAPINLIDVKLNNTVYYERTNEQINYEENDGTITKLNYNNYYKVNDNTVLKSNGVYGTLTANGPTYLTLENFPADPANSNYYIDGDTDNLGAEYVKITSDLDFKNHTIYEINWKSVSLKDVQTTKPYQADKYYIGTNSTMSPENWKRLVKNWLEGTAVPSMDDLETLRPCRVNTLQEAANLAMGANYCFFEGVQIDPTATSFIWVNDYDNPMTVSRSQTLDNKFSEENNKWFYTSTIKNVQGEFIKEELLNVVINGNNIEYDAKLYDNETTLDAEYYTLKEWENIFGENDESTHRLIQVYALRKQQAGISYSLVNATPVDLFELTENNISALKWYYNPIDHPELYVKEALSIDENTGEPFIGEQMQSRMDAGDKYFTFEDEDLEKNIAFYSINNNLYKEVNNNYIKETARQIGGSTYQSQTGYYTIENFNANTYGPFIPNKYYYNDNGVYKLATAYNQGNNGQFYENAYTYVMTEGGLVPKGSAWYGTKEEATQAGLQIGTRKEIFVAKELTGFAKNFNTIHGLILRLNDILGDNDSRDQNTIQGCINSVHDLLSKFTVFKPNSLIWTDNYGRITAGEVNGGDDNAITVTSDSINHTLSITHAELDDFQNKKIFKYDSGLHGIGINSPVFNNYGHIDSYSQQPIILNKWISLRDSGNAGLEVKHSQYKGDEDSTTVYGNNNGTVYTSFKVPCITVDAAGHISTAIDKTITVPSNYLPIGTENDAPNVQSYYGLKNDINGKWGVQIFLDDDNHESDDGTPISVHDNYYLSLYPYSSYNIFYGNDNILPIAGSGSNETDFLAFLNTVYGNRGLSLKKPGIYRISGAIALKYIDAENDRVRVTIEKHDNGVTPLTTSVEFYSDIAEQSGMFNTGTSLFKWTQTDIDNNNLISFKFQLLNRSSEGDPIYYSVNLIKHRSYILLERVDDIRINMTETIEEETV